MSFSAKEIRKILSKKKIFKKNFYFFYFTPLKNFFEKIDDLFL